MLIIDDRTVELTEAEQAAYRSFHLLLDEGHDIPTAARKARDQHPGLTQAFYKWMAR
jgi:hypothetical protein